MLNGDFYGEISSLLLKYIYFLSLLFLLNILHCYLYVSICFIFINIKHTLNFVNILNRIFNEFHLKRKLLQILTWEFGIKCLVFRKGSEIYVQNWFRSFTTLFIFWAKSVLWHLNLSGEGRIRFRSMCALVTTTSTFLFSNGNQLVFWVHSCAVNVFRYPKITFRKIREMQY